MADGRPAVVVVDDEPSDGDRAAVAALLDREPKGRFTVVVRHAADGSPVVIRNHPLLADGTPMPTRYWLLGEPERTMVSRVESRGGVHRVEDEIGLDVIELPSGVGAVRRHAVAIGRAVVVEGVPVSVIRRRVVRAAPVIGLDHRVEHRA